MTRYSGPSLWTVPPPFLLHSIGGRDHPPSRLPTNPASHLVDPPARQGGTLSNPVGLHGGSGGIDRATSTCTRLGFLLRK